LYKAICDGDKKELAQISSFFNLSNHERQPVIMYQKIQNITKILSANWNKANYLILLDVMMPHIGNTTTARQTDKETIIIHFAVVSEFASENDKTRFFNCILKPATKGRLKPLLGKLRSKHSHSQGGIITKTQLGLIHTLLTNPAFVEIMKNSLQFFLTGILDYASTALSNFQGILFSRPKFICVCHSYIVNFQQIRTLFFRQLTTLGGKSILLFKFQFSKAKDIYVDCLFKGSEVIQCK